MGGFWLSTHLHQFDDGLCVPSHIFQTQIAACIWSSGDHILYIVSSPNVANDVTTQKSALHRFLVRILFLPEQSIE
jgi:hypothetical protein